MFLTFLQQFTILPLITYRNTQLLYLSACVTMETLTVRPIVVLNLRHVRDYIFFQIHSNVKCDYFDQKREKSSSTI